MSNIIKKINVGTVTYDIYDEYARRRLEGEGTVYSISYSESYEAGTTYIDIKDGEIVTEITSSGMVANMTFNSANDPITISQPQKYLILRNTHPTANTKWVIQISELTLSDTIYVVEKTVQSGNECPDRWVSAVGSSYVFSAIQAKTDLSGYVEHGTYTSAGPNTDTTGSTSVSGTAASAGAQTATGTATVTVGNHTINNDNLKISASGTQSVGTHTHSVDISTISYVTSVSEAAAGAHTHDVDSHTHTSVTVTKTVTFTQGTDNFTAGSLPSLSITATTVGNSLTGDTSFLKSATVSDGILSFTDGSVGLGTTSVGSASGWSAGTLPTFTQGTDTFSASTVSVASTGSAATLTAKSAGAHSHTITALTAVAYPITSVNGGGAHTVDFSKAAVTLSTPCVLTHSVTAGAASVAVSSHTHSVDCGSHTHSLSAHVHNTTL